MDRMLSFLAHEYFHHYNVKRIRPLELGPFDYDKGNRTNLLWVSEGFTVYYESHILKRAGLIDALTFVSHFEAELNTLENDPGRLHQSLSQASYSTWEEGPFGGRGSGPAKAISVYNKGAVVALLLDLEIRHATKNRKSLDDVMRTLYRTYYKEEQRGFTDAEFQNICEQIAGRSLTDLFEYVYTTKEIDYAAYLSHAGLGVDKQVNGANGNPQILKIKHLSDPDSLQSEILSSWLRD
jgi:predicted metalloprotease with PDZ domain